MGALIRPEGGTRLDWSQYVGKSGNAGAVRLTKQRRRHESEAGCERLVVPYFATVHSAYGAALSDIRFSLQFSEPIVLPNDALRIERIFKDMENKGAEALERAEVPPASRRYNRWVEASAKDLLSVSQYGRQNPSEDFADFTRLYVSTNDDAAQLESLRGLGYFEER